MGYARNRTLSAFGWKFLERLIFQGTNFIVTLVLARLLSPGDYGLVALVLVFVAFANTFVQGGFNTALIQKKDANGGDFFSVLIFSLVVAAALYAALFFGAPLLADYYGMSQIIPIIRILSLVVFPAAVNSIQVAWISKAFRFRVLTVSSLISMLLAAMVSIFLAIKGFGAWALVVQQLISHTGACVINYLLTGWLPRGKFSMNRIRHLVPFGSRVLASNLLVTFFMELRSLIIGRMYTPVDLGYFKRGKQFPQTVMDSVSGTIQSVLLPVYAREQDNQQRILDMVRHAIRLSSFLIFPLMVGLACVAEPLIRLLLTDKWLPSVPFLQVFAFAYLCQPAQIATAQAYKALGDSTTPLKLEFFRKTVEIGLLLMSLRYGVFAIAASSVAAGVISLAAAIWPNIKKLRYSLKAQLSDLAPAFLLSLGMAAVLILLGRMIQNAAVALALQTFIGGSFYLVFARIFRMKALSAINSILANILKSLGERKSRR